MAKGVAIILMVLVHARFSHYGDTFINMFHMPLFFFMSGYCFKREYLDNFVTFIKKRIKGAYWPYVKWGLVFLLLHNLFFRLNIYNSEFGFRGVVSKIYDAKDFLRNGLLIVGTMNGAEQLLGGYWFLHSYFFASIISFCIVYCFKNHLRFISIGCLVLLMVSILMSGFSLSVPFFIGAREVLASAFMVAGVAYRHSNWTFERYPLIMVPLGAAVVALGASFWPCNMLSLTWDRIGLFFISALFGTFMVFSICVWLGRYMFPAKALAYVGDRTLCVLTWHLLSFKIVSIVIILIYCLPKARLAEFPVIEFYAYKGWWGAYLFIGLAVPLIIDYVSGKIRSVVL